MTLQLLEDCFGCCVKNKVVQGNIQESLSGGDCVVWVRADGVWDQGGGKGDGEGVDRLGIYWGTRLIVQMGGGEFHKRMNDD